MARCEQCNGPMDGKRAGSRTCSTACRKALSRRLSGTASGTEVKCDRPQSMNRKCGPIPGDPDYNGVAKQKKFMNHWQNPDKVQFRPDDQPASAVPRMDLPDDVPDVVRARYARGDGVYVATINRLIRHTIPELQAKRISIPVWRYQMEGPVHV